MSPPAVACTREDDIAVVTIERPERRNALDSSMALTLAQTIEEQSQQARVVILTGSGEAFCAGGDLE